MAMLNTRIVFITLSFFLFSCGGGSGSSSTQTSASVDKSDPTVFELEFVAQGKGVKLNCMDMVNGLGDREQFSVGVTDLRFYVSNLTFFNDANEEIPFTLDDNAFQLNHEAGSVALIDFSSTQDGFCALAQEGTPRTNTKITGMAEGSNISAVSFDVGVPQALMKAVIAATDEVSDTPSPLGEMYWSWASGYRHFVINFVAMDASHTDQIENSGFHIGSRDCGNGGAKALSDKDSCGLLNTPKVLLQEFNPEINRVAINVDALFTNAAEKDFLSDVWTAHGGGERVCVDDRRRNDQCVTGQNFGLQCHSASAQVACQSLFPNFGLELQSGLADPVKNSVFSKL